MKFVIVIPTYNEASNVEKLVTLIDEQIRNISHEFVALFVDDSSPDGTADLLKKLKTKFPFIEVYVRKEKQGIGAAYLAGFKRAMSEYKADVVMEMDADLQHDPKTLPEFVKAIEDGYDYVLGSRYVNGGSVPKEWAFIRKFLSWGGSLFARFMLGVISVKDFTTGYKATRVRNILDSINLEDVTSNGFAYKIDLLYRTHKIGAKIKEIPIQFGLRDRGDSKMEQDNFMDSLRVVFQLRIKEFESFIKFLMVGLVGLFVDTLFFNLFRVTLLPSNYSSALSGFLAMITTFLLNNSWSFRSNKISGLENKVKLFLPYALSSYLPILLRSYIVWYSINKYGDNFLIANITFFIGILIGLVWNYTIYSRIIWRKKIV